MNFSKWQHRIANTRKIKNSRKPMGYQIARLHEEVSEMFMEIRKGKDLNKVVYKVDDRGFEKPFGFKAELGDALSQILHIADLTGVDPEEALEISVRYHEAKQAAAGPKIKKGKK